MIRPSTRQARVLVAGLVAGLLVAASASAEPAAIADKRAHAQRVLAEIRQIDSEVSRAAEAYNHANVKLDRIAGEQRDNARKLVLARVNLGHAQRRLHERLVTLYTSGAGGGSAMEVLLGATSLDDLIERLETVERVSSQDTHVLEQVKAFRHLVQRRKAQLARARAEQEQVVATRAAAKRAVEARLVQRQQLLSSIRSEIERLERAEAARQAQLRREAEARLRAQQAAERRATAQATAASSQADPQEAPAASSEATVATSTAPARYGGVVGIAMQYLGVPYKWGGASPSTGFDCSGFVMYVFGKMGVSLPHRTYALYAMGSPVDRSQLQPGDLVFFNGLGHMGIYIGGNQMIHAPHTGDVVKISSLSGWYSSTWVGARRL